MLRSVRAAGLCVAAVCALAPLERASAQTACERPGAPACVADATTFVSAERMTDCQREVKQYVDQTLAYLTCLSDEHQQTAAEMARVVDRFNCRLSRGNACP